MSYRKWGFERKKVFRIRGKLKDRMVEVMDRSIIGRIEFEVLKKMNEYGIKNKDCSYRIIVNKFSWKVNVCSKKEDDKNVIDEVIKDLRFDKYKVVGRIKSFKKIDSRYFSNEVKYKVHLFDVEGNYGYRKNIKMNNNFFEWEELEEDVELFRELYNWNKWIVNGKSFENER